MKKNRTSKWIRNFVATGRPEPFKVMRQVAHFVTRKNTSIEFIIKSLDLDEATLRRYNPWIPEDTESLRPNTRVAYPGKALGVSYTEKGLVFTCSNRGKLFYFQDAFYVDPVVGPRGDLSKSEDVVIEDFVPRDHYRFRGNQVVHNDSAQKAEIMWTDKALRMLYVTDPWKNSDNNKLVYSTNNVKK